MNASNVNDRNGPPLSVTIVSIGRILPVLRSRAARRRMISESQL